MTNTNHPWLKFPVRNQLNHLQKKSVWISSVKFSTTKSSLGFIEFYWINNSTLEDCKFNAYSATLPQCYSQCMWHFSNTIISNQTYQILTVPSLDSKISWSVGIWDFNWKSHDPRLKLTFRVIENNDSAKEQREIVELITVYLAEKRALAPRPTSEKTRITQ